ncbi:glycosyltransferase family 4 protein [Oceanihabitans sp. IOP_32]|uniref:glycosyltransferase n=1 Tax=Oceanihabitans sp. IOP_32 TaxID=2529032 RepID=UPI00129398AC|nr:glycosyltransferase [Oceanihabitans sp. IOP_32]QFZ53394.1 glycosyltransferase family 4 protein [Oceanihabitans sp. IOP_32]
MRLLQITASNVWRGHEQQIVYYYEAFNAKIEHQVLICPSETKLAEVANHKNFNVHSLPLKSQYSLSWIKKIKRVVKDEKIDLILIHSSRAHTLCVLASKLSYKKTPLVFFRTLIKDISGKPLSIWKYNYKYLVKLICVSQAVVEALKPSIKDPSRFAIVGSATDLSVFKNTKKTYKLHKELELPEDTILIANISAFVKFKDHYTFVKTAKILKDKIPNAKFLLIGTGNLQDEILTFVKEENLEDTVLFLGFREDIPEIFPDFDIFLFTSKLEPTGGVLLEAYASHVPIVATNAGGIPEVVVHNKTGFLCEKENPEAFAQAVLKLLEDDTLKDAFIKNGYQRLQDHFTKEVITKHMFEELLKVHKAYY